MILKILFTYSALISAVFFLFGCSKEGRAVEWNTAESHTYLSVDSTDNMSMIVPAYSVPDGGVLFFDSFDDSIDITNLPILSFQHMVSDYQIISDFVLISANFEDFIIPAELNMDYCHTFRYNMSSQYYHHSDLQLYKINHKDILFDAIVDMNNWTSIPFTFTDTSYVGIAGPGKISTQITDANAIYVIARKINN